MKEDIIAAHEFCTGNKKQLKKDSLCGCFYCLKIFDPKEIDFWIKDKKGKAAICPYCRIDSVIGQSSGYPITEDFLSKMKDHWF